MTQLFGYLGTAEPKPETGCNGRQSIGGSAYAEPPVSTIPASSEAPCPSHVKALLSSTAPRELLMTDLSEADWEGLLPKGFRRTAGREEALGWDLPFLAFWLAEKPEHNVGMLGIRELVARVDCVEAGHFGRHAQQVLNRPSEPSLALRKALSKSKAVPPQWDTNNFAVQALVFEVAQARYAAGTWRPAAWA